MSGTPLNRQFIYPGNQCFGCGADNPEGLRIDIHRDGLRLSAEIAREAEGKAPCLIKTGLASPDGEVLSEADFEYVLVPQDELKRVAGLDQLPDHYVRHFGEMA